MPLFKNWSAKLFKQKKGKRVMPPLSGGSKSHPRHHHVDLYGGLRGGWVLLFSFTEKLVSVEVGLIKWFSIFKV
jgi:hypothetical protein